MSILSRFVTSARDEHSSLRFVTNRNDVVTSFKIASEWSRAQKKLQILKAQAFSFPMIYIMSGYEKIDFMTFFDVRALKWPQNGPEPKKNTVG